MNGINVGCTIITTNEYKDLIVREFELERTIKECENQISNLKERYEMMEKHFLDDLYSDEKWDIRHLEFKEGTLEQDYHYNNIFSAFVKKGIKDTLYIQEKILEFYNKNLEETKEEENNE